MLRPLRTITLFIKVTLCLYLKVFQKKKEEEYEKFEKCLNELKKDAREYLIEVKFCSNYITLISYSRKCNQTEEKFYKYQKNLVDLNEKMELLKLNNFEVIDHKSCL